MEPDAEKWWAVHGWSAPGILTGLGLDLDAEGTPTRAHELLRRIEVDLVSARTISNGNRDRANLLTRSLEDAGRLLSLLAGTAWARLGGAEIRSEQLHDVVREAGLPLVRGDSSVAERLASTAAEFRESLRTVRELSWIPRRETDDAWRALSTRAPPITVLVHGPAGSGKSEVLGALSERMKEANWSCLMISIADPRIGPPPGGHGLGEDPVGSLVLHAAGARVALVLDQLDSALWAGGEAQRLIRPVRALLERARELGVSVVIGCRTVDARLDTQLSLMIEGEGAGAVHEAAMGDLPEASIAAALAEIGVPLLDLPPPIRRLACRPLLLRLICSLLRRGGDLRDVRSWPTLVDRWWEQVERDLDRRGCSGARESFEKLVDRMERARSWSAPTGCPRRRFSTHSPAPA